jgi:cation diffusion facilitator CzcD-associated flavoprotein CzcO
VADKYDLRKNVKFHSRVTETIWDEVAGKWNLRIENVQTGEIFDDSCDIFIDGSGVLKYSYLPLEL